MKKMIQDIKLAIVIPFYKITFFEETLKALVKQNDKRFNVYIGDDASLKNPQRLVEKYQEILNISYIRFENNLGATDLVGQWHRCLNMSADEEWVWILPDDDVPSINVVEEFYKALSFVHEYNVKIFRFPMSIIDKEGKIIHDYAFDEPQIETNLAFYERIVRSKATATIGDNIFHKKSLLEQGQFVDFPKAWGSDHATVLCAAQDGKIYNLKKAHLYFRMSGENISSDITDGLIKIDSRIRFAHWLQSHEDIFPHKPDKMFYKHFYWKAEYYILNTWLFDMRLFYKLYLLRTVCFNSKNIVPIVKIFFKKLLGVS
jgi:hypothetical protein